MAGFVVALIGLVAVVASGIITRRFIRATFGGLDQFSIKGSEGTGVVPSWVSAINLAGWAAIVIGIVVGLVLVVA